MTRGVRKYFFTPFRCMIDFVFTARTIALLLVCGACSNRPPGMATTHSWENDPPPLPPMKPQSPIGVLLAHAADLEIPADKVDRLKTIDDDLTGTNASLENELGDLERATGQAAGSGSGRRGGMRGGRGGASPGGGAPPSTGQAQQPTSEKQAKLDERRAEAQRIRQEMSQNTTTALSEAFQLLDPAQRERARALLVEAGALKQP